MPTISPQILDTPQGSLPVRDRRIQIILLPIMIDTKALKRQIPPRTIMRLHRPRQEQWALHRQLLHPILHHTQFQRNDTSDLDGATEANLSIALAEMKVTLGKSRSQLYSS